MVGSILIKYFSQEYEARLQLFINRFLHLHFQPSILIFRKFPQVKKCVFSSEKIFRSMETGGCSIYRELLRLHFNDEETFCEDGILAEVFPVCINPGFGQIQPYL